MSRRTVCLRKLGGNRAGGMRFGRFLHNQAVTAKEMIATAACATGLRTLGNGTDIGLLLHPLVAVDAGHGGIIGLAGAEIINRRDGKVEDRKTRPLAEKESRRWLSGMQSARAVLHGAGQVTVVGGRESDIFGLFAGRCGNVHLLVRAAQNRGLEDGGRLFKTVRGWPVQDRYAIDVPVKPGQIARRAVVALRFGAVSLKRPATSPKHWPLRIDLHAVDVFEEDAANRFDPRFLAALGARLEGKTEKPKNPHPPGSLASLAWIAGRLGGWSGYTSKGCKPAGPKTMHDGLLQLQARHEGWKIAKCG